MPGITAPRTFHPGEVIHTEEPYVKLLGRDFKDEACASCFEWTENLKFCKQCLEIKYCGQKTDWKNHRLECKYLKNLQVIEFVNVDHIRLLGNIILKIKGQDWKTMKSTVLGTEVSFDDIDTRLENAPENNLKVLHRKGIKEHVRMYIGDENMPNEEDFMKIFGKVYSNIFCIKMFSGSDVACDIYNFTIGVSLLEHECIPNCNISSASGVHKIWAIKEIKMSEKISISHQDILPSTPFFSDVNGSCKCTECSLPYGESLLTKIIDEKQAFGVIIRTQQFLALWNSFASLFRDRPITKIIVEDLLEEHENVLGNTNALHLRLLAIKCLENGGHPLEMKRDLKKLEKNMIAVYGEYFVKMIEIYEALANVSFLLGDFREGRKYFEKQIYLEKLLQL